MTGPRFETVRTEHRDHECPVEGSVPPWLDGVLVRNGPGRFEIGGERVAHWFDGLAMLRRYAVADGSVRYSNRFLRTDAYRAADEGGQPGFASGGSYLSRLLALFGEPTDNANVTVDCLGGDHVALTETPRRVIYDPTTLDTVGEVVYDDDHEFHHVAAHLRHDPERRERIGFGTRFGLGGRYHVYRVPDGTRRREIVGSEAVDEPAYLHSLALTANYVILTEHPFVVSPRSFLDPRNEGFIDAYRWNPERDLRFLVFARDGTIDGDRGTDDADVGPVATATAPPAFVFHHVGAAGDGDALVVDCVAFPDADIVTDLALEDLTDRMDGTLDGALRRYRIPLDGGESTVETLYEGMALPTTSTGSTSGPSGGPGLDRYVYGQSTGRAGGTGLVKVDVETGTATEWWEDGLYASEPTFVPDPGGPGGDTDVGVVIAPAAVTEEDAEETVLLMLDGETMSEVARAHLPHQVPPGFHGRWYPGA